MEQGGEEVECRVGGYVERLEGEMDGCVEIFRSCVRTCIGVQLRGGDLKRLIVQ